jgi:CBS domain-containing protein
MTKRTVKELALPLDYYAVVLEDATLLDAVTALEKAQEKLPAGRQPHRAVLVSNRQGAIIGKIDQAGFLRSLEPKYNMLGDPQMMTRAGVRPDLITSMMDHYQLFQDNFRDICMRGRLIIVKDVMRRGIERISEDASLGEAIHQLVMYQTLSLLVMRNDQAVGVLRLSDMYDEIATEMKKALQDLE